MAPEHEVLIGGNSHIAAMGVPRPTDDAISLVEVNETPIQGRRVFGLSAPHAVKQDGSYWQHLTDHCAGRIIVLSFKGNQHVDGFLFRRGGDFDIPTGPTLAGATLVPRKVVETTLAQSFKELPEIISRLYAAGAVRVLVLGTPPPKGDRDVVLSRMRRSSEFVGRAKNRGIDLSDAECLTPTSVLTKVWSVMQDLSKRSAESAGAEFLPVPEDTKASDGTLAQDYWSGDATHANNAFGSRMLQIVAEAIAT